MVTINQRDKLKWHDRMTVKDLLQRMHYSYSLITVTVNGEFVAKDDYEEYEVPDNSDVTVFHLAHGG